MDSLNVPPDPLRVVMLADSDDETRVMYGEYFRNSQVELEEARDGREALAKALARPHDVIVTETRLPGISGYELCELLRHDPATAATPIVVVTGEAYPANLDRARRAGADVVIVKPCLPDILLVEMRRLLAPSAGVLEQSQEVPAGVADQMSGFRELQLQGLTRRRALSRQFNRVDTTTPPAPPPALVCPICDRPLNYRRSHVGGVSERHREQWDYYECPDGCGSFQFRQRTRKLRKVS